MTDINERRKQVISYSKRMFKPNKSPLSNPNKRKTSLDAPTIVAKIARIDNTEINNICHVRDNVLPHTDNADNADNADTTRCVLNTIIIDHCLAKLLGEHTRLVKAMAYFSKDKVKFISKLENVQKQLRSHEKDIANRRAKLNTSRNW